MLFKKTEALDAISILRYLQTFSKDIGVTGLKVDSNAVYRACIRMREELPCKNGLDNASVFKRTAMFVASFLEEQPLDPKGFQDSTLTEDIKKYNANAIVALNIAILNILDAAVHKNGQIYKIDNGIVLSRHSYCDIVNMLDVGDQHHFMSLSLLFEQITYKTNPELQYDKIYFGSVKEKTPVNDEEDLLKLADDTLPKAVYESETPEIANKFDDLPVTPSLDQPGFSDPDNNRGNF